MPGSKDEPMVPSSPPKRSNGKERRNPSITPRKFKRFFTPRPRPASSHLTSGHISPARMALRDLAGPGFNDRYMTPDLSSPLKPPAEDDDIPDENIAYPKSRVKRRKIQQTPDSSPCRSFSIEPISTSFDSSRHDTPGLRSPIRSLQSSQEILDCEEESEDEDLDNSKPVTRIAPLTTRGLPAHLLQRQLGGMPRAGKSYMSYPVSDWRMETANFYSRPDDAHSCSSHETAGHCIPFCTAACHTNGLVAVGDEEGTIRLLESSGDSSSQAFSGIHLAFQAHTNAIIDLAFSDDDHLLATASGDQTGRVIDMMTQSPVALLNNHNASLKQVRFQPGKANSSVLATSSRDGSIQIWDLRCKGPVGEILEVPERNPNLGFRVPRPKQGCAVNSIYDAHARTKQQVQEVASSGPGDTPSRGEIPGRIGGVSVTALQFLPAGQEHLLLSACEADASIRLWDIRVTSRHRSSTPVSCTTPPTAHSHWRPFGISSLALSTDSSRFYALCKDNTVYAYSTTHLIMGQAPELSSRDPPRRPRAGAPHTGLGPLYGFRHPNFHATSFYVKCAVRPARDGRDELLAVGSSDGCAVLFPTAERYFRPDLSATSMQSLTQSLESTTIATSIPAPGRVTRSGLHHRPLFGLERQASSSSIVSSKDKDDIPIIRNGTPLVRGHDREVGGLEWTNRGSLVTIGDDYLIRCWREGREEAKDLRCGGEGGGRRWGCGYADFGGDWEGDRDDDDC